MPLFKKEILVKVVQAIVAAGGSDAREAKIVAENLVTANLTGHDSHGVGMIPRYIESLLEGGLVVNQHPEIVFDGGTMISLDKVYDRPRGESNRLAPRSILQQGSA